MNVGITGSWFIQDICSEIRESKGDLSVTDWTLNVKNRVQKRVEEKGCYLQIPTFISRIAKGQDYIIPKYSANF